MKWKISTAIASVLLMSFGSFGNTMTSGSLNPGMDDIFESNAFNCELQVITQNPKNSISVEFEISSSGNSSHGGKVREFKKGKSRILFQSTGQWLALNWFSEVGTQSSGEATYKKIAHATNVVTNPSNHSRTLIVHHPKKDNQQAFITCTQI